MKTPEFVIGPAMIAHCGMNCGICIGYLREKKPCSGCNGEDSGKPNHCRVCRIKRCDEIVVQGKLFCFECGRFPCTRLRQLDKRYRTNYGMSMIDNLESIKELGLEKFVIRERDRWRCPACGGIISVHRPVCIYCGQSKG